MDFKELTIKKALTSLKNGTVDAKELVDYYIDNIKTDNAREDKLNAVIYTDREGAYKQIEKLSKDKPLYGMPVLVKDNFNVKGHEVRCASDILKDYISPYDGGVVDRLKENGAVIFGRTNMDEFAMGSSTEYSVYGNARNPVNREYITGGSSGGAAASVAGDQSICSLGSDTGGSIRQPAGICGVVGLKPTYGRVSRYGLVAYGSSLDQIGPVTKTVEDAAIILNAIAGYDNRDSTSVDTPIPDYTRDLESSLKGKKIGLPKEYFTEDLSPVIKERIDKVVEFYKSQGVEVREVSLPATIYAVGTYYILATAEASANLARFDGVRYGRRSKEATELKDVFLKSRNEGFGDEVKRRILLGTYVLSSGYYDAYYLQAQKVRRIIKEDFEKAFKDVDALMMPVTPEETFKIGEKSDDPVKMYLSDIYTVSLNLAGLPGMAVPCGKDDNGLPVGFQLVTSYFNESTLLNMGHIYNKENP